MTTRHGNKNSGNDDEHSLFAHLICHISRRRRSFPVIFISIIITIVFIGLCLLPLINFVAWSTAPPLKNDGPEAWLERDCLVHVNYMEAQETWSNKQASRSEVDARESCMHAVDKETIQKLIAFGAPSIRPCIDAMLFHRFSEGVAISVLQGLGDLSIEPLVSTVPRHGQIGEGMCQVLTSMTKNPANDLARLACTDGMRRGNAIDALAYFISEKPYTRSGAMGKPGAIIEQYRQPLLDQLDNEKDPETRRGLLLIQEYFTPPTSDDLGKIILVLEHDQVARVRATAAEVLSVKLKDADPECARMILSALTASLSGPDFDSVKLAACNGFKEAGTKVDQSAMSALRRAAGGSSYPLRQASLQALLHLFAFDRSCLPELAESLNEDDPNTVYEAKHLFATLGSEDKKLVRRLQGASLK